MSSQTLKQERLCGPHEYDHLVQPGVAGEFYALWKTRLYNIISFSEAPAGLCGHTVVMLSEASVGSLCFWAPHTPYIEFIVS